MARNTLTKSAQAQNLLSRGPVSELPRLSQCCKRLDQAVDYPLDLLQPPVRANFRPQRTPQQSSPAPSSCAPSGILTTAWASHAHLPHDRTTFAPLSRGSRIQ